MAGKNSEALLINKNGTAVNTDSITYLVSTYSEQLEKRITPGLIRASVITHLLKQGHDLRVVQAFAGHKKTSTTERYRQTGLQELKNTIAKLHPLG